MIKNDQNVIVHQRYLNFNVETKFSIVKTFQQLIAWLFAGLSSWPCKYHQSSSANIFMNMTNVHMLLSNLQYCMTPCFTLWFGITKAIWPVKDFTSAVSGVFLKRAVPHLRTQKCFPSMLVGCWLTVGWATWRHLACKKTGCWFVGGDDLTGAVHDL